MSTVVWQRVRIPPVERLVLTDLACRRGLSDEEMLVEIIHREASRELQRQPTGQMEVADHVG